MTNHVTIITATRGIGLSLAKHATASGLGIHTIGVTAGNIGISNALPAEPVDCLIDIEKPYNLDRLEFKKSRFFIWSTGAFLKIPLYDMTDQQIENLSELHYNIPLRLLSRFQRQHTEPYHLIIIASCSSWRLRESESVYCGLSAAKATFARNIANDLTRERPGSKVTLFNPGGIRTPFYYESDTEGEGYIDPNWLAEYMWSTIINQTETFNEQHILRKKPVIIGSKPDIQIGQKIPEVITT